MSVDILIIGKGGEITVKASSGFDEGCLLKKCGFKSAKGFEKQTEWSVKISGTKYVVALFAKTNGKAMTENKYDFPPPVDNMLYFGNCAIVGYIKDSEGIIPASLSCELWDLIYAKLFGGFEDLDATAAEDENEIDELDSVPAAQKTKNGGYLKDGFVVDSDEEVNEGFHDEGGEGGEDVEDGEDGEEEDEDEDEECDSSESAENLGSELSEESYETDSSEETS